MEALSSSIRMDGGSKYGAVRAQFFQQAGESMASHLSGHTTTVPIFMKRSKLSYLVSMLRKSRQHVVLMR